MHQLFFKLRSFLPLIFCIALTSPVAGQISREDSLEISRLRALGNEAKKYSSDSAIFYYNKALSLGKKINDRETIAKMHFNVGLSFWDQNAFDSSQHHAEEALKASRAINFNLGICASHQLVALNYFRAKDFRKSSYNFMKAYEYALLAQDTERAISSAISIVAAYEAQGKIDSAKYKLKILQKLAPEEKYPLNYHEIQKTRTRYLVNEKKLKEAERTLVPTIAYYRKENLQGYLSECLSILSSIYQQQGKAESARTALAEAIAIAERHDIKESLEAFYNSRFYLDSVQGDFKSAAFHARAAYRTRAFLDSLKQSQETDKLLVKFELKEKDYENRILTLKNEAAERKIHNLNLLILLTILLAASVTIAAVLILQRQRHQRELIFQSQKRETDLRALRAQIDPHLVQNVFHIISLQLESTKLDEIRKIIKDSSVYFRSLLNESSKSKVTLEEELMLLEKYIRFQQNIRHFDYLLVVEPTVDTFGIEVPGLLLQPFIENSVKHGFTGKPGEKVTVNIQQEPSKLIVIIEDNGKGLSTNDDQNKTTPRGIALTQERLNLFYPGVAPTITSESLTSPSGYRTTIVIPITPPLS